MEWWDQLSDFLRLREPVEDVGVLAMVARSAIIYLTALLLVRLASLRLLAKSSAFDVIVAVMLGSILSRAINGSAPLLPTVAAAAVLLILQGLLAFIARHTTWLGPVVKGEPVLLIDEGEIQEKGLRAADLTREDLIESLRLNISDDDPKRVRQAYFERNGKISVIPFPDAPKVVEVKVEEGVKSLRIEL